MIGGVAVIAIIAIAAVALSRSEPETLDPGTPEGVVQAYVRAILDGDDDTAIGLFSDELRERCTEGDFGQHGYVPDAARVVLRTVNDFGGSARVTIAITEGGGGFGDSGYTFEEEFRLDRSGDTWVITRAPWPYYDCGF